MSLQQSKIFYHQGRYAEHYYLCNYIPSRSGADKLSHSLIRFKEALAYDLQAWIDCAVSELEKLKMTSDTIVIRALGSEETKTDENSNTALDKLCKAIGETYGCQWKPGLIGKPQHQRSLKSLTWEERRKEIRHAYYLSQEYFDFDRKEILLIDDIITTGATVTAIIGLIKEYFSRARFTVFTLAKTAYIHTLNDDLHLHGSGYKWEDSMGWKVAEDEEPYNNYTGLCNCIRKDDFMS